MKQQANPYYCFFGVLVPYTYTIFFLGGVGAGQRILILLF